MPEAPMHEDNKIMAGKNDVGFARQGAVFWPVDCETVAKAVQDTPHE